MEKIELLAPAGEWDALVAAVENGADAVYPGGKQFSARRTSANFTDEELERGVDYAHVRGAKIYVAVNTLLNDEEMAGAMEYILFLYRIGVNAVIVQDLGLAGLVPSLFPALDLHASTQMTTHNGATAQFLAQKGFGRVILERQLTLPEIKVIREQTGIEVEVFAHGALCIAYSGQCLMSSLIGGRSGNRGRCAQPCRLEYTLVDSRGRSTGTEGIGEHLLSPKDLNLAAYLPKLIEAGVSGIKIEGRMKRPEYVATVVRIYRQLIDRYYADPAAYKVTEAEEQELAQIFNRDFTTGFVEERQGAELISYGRPSNRGLYLGRVVSYDYRERRAVIRLELGLSVGDGIEVWVTEGGRIGANADWLEVNGQRVQSALTGETATLAIEGRIRPGDRVFKTQDADLIARARQTYASPKATRKVPVQAWVNAALGEPLTLSLTDPDGNRVDAATEVMAAAARNRPLTEAVITGQLERLGNTPYLISHLDYAVAPGLMVPLSAINEVRRQAVDNLTRLRAERAKPADVAAAAQRIQEYPLLTFPAALRERVKPLLAVNANTREKLTAARRAKADWIYFGGEVFRSSSTTLTPDDYAWAVEQCRSGGTGISLVVPRITKESQPGEIAKWIETLATLQPDALRVANPGALHLARTLTDCPVQTDYPLYAFNSQALHFLRQQGAVRATVSPELTFEQIEALRCPDGMNLECIVHGAMTLMITEYCLPGSLLGQLTEGNACAAGACRNGPYGLRDRLDYTFPVESDQDCRQHIFNARELCLVEHLPRFIEAGIGSLRLEVQRNPAEYVERVTAIYRTALDQAWANPAAVLRPETKAELERLSGSGLTKGHYFRGVE